MIAALIFIATFVVGVITGAVGEYFAAWFTDWRHAREERKAQHKRFAEVEALMPALIAEMRTDLAINPTVRDFLLLQGRVALSGGPRRFAYFAEKHDSLRGKVAILENNRYVVDVTPGNTLTFRMSEKFVEHLRRVVS